ncbi:CBS domain-containing protein [Dissulfurirhabdus thermomarina]|nr:chloride channel protein [Dissulfurirhabdus thermomarina]NMX22925.1 CBS domain-containing protein [Dissulfurirhabdus thermomarina]
MRRRLFRPPPRGGRRALFGEHLFMVLVAIVCGLAGGFGAVAFRELIKLFQTLFWGGGRDLLHLALSHPWTWRVAAPALGGLVVGPLVYYFAKEAKGHGVPEVMEAVMLRGGAIRPRVVLVKSLASAVCISSGGSVGREGPIVQIGSALGSAVGQVLKVTPRQLRTLVACGAAAGIAATFNAPIAGALFAVEIILGDFRVPQFSPIVISSVVATVVSRHFLGNFPAFEVPPYHLVSPLELPIYMVVGAASGLVALAFIKTLTACEDLFEWLPFPEPLKAVLGGLLVGAVGIRLPHVFGVGYETINQALVGALPAGMLALLLLAKLAATSLTIGSGGSGGVFAPSLFLGAVTGGVLGTFVHHAFPAVTAASGAYALVTMGAVVAAATHAPITAIIMIFELTDEYTIIPPLMAACVVSTLLATLLEKDSIYTVKLRRRGVDLAREEDPNVLKSVRVRDVMDPLPAIIPGTTPFREVLDVILRRGRGAFFVVNMEEELLGTLSLEDVRFFAFQREDLQGVVVAADMVHPDVPRVTTEDTLDVAVQILAEGGRDEIAVVDPENPRRIVGSLLEKDVLRAYSREIYRRDLAGAVASATAALDRVRHVDIGDGYLLAELPAPRSFVGRTLRELDIRVRYGLQILFVRTRDGDAAPRVLVPLGEYRVRDRDVLVAAGPRQAVEELMDLQ